MTEQYDEIAAAHYAAYRPPLHRMILQRLLSTDESFSLGLDVGCGTGYSAIALSGHCARVYGIDPSPWMLSRATAHTQVTYLEGAAERIPLPDRSVDVVTFAGSLFYADTGAACGQLRRVCREDAVVVVYDFEILLEKVLQRFGMELHAGESDYDHRVNFSGEVGFEELAVGRDRIAVDMRASDLAHILLSDSNRLYRFAEMYHNSDFFPVLEADLRSEFDNARLEAKIYYSKYRLNDV